MSDENVKKERLPSGSACASCRKRKNRCDGCRPKCSGCRSRGIACNYPSMLASQLSIEELKAFMEAKLRDSTASTSPRSHQQELQHIDEDEEEQRTLRSVEQGRQPIGLNGHLRASADLLGPSREAFRTPVQERIVIDRSRESVQQELEPSNSLSLPESPEPEGYFGDSSSFAFVSKVVPDASDERVSSRKKQRLARMSRSYGNGSERDLSLTSQEWDACFDLPDRELADSLLDAYFDRVHHLYPFVHEPSFRVDYERIWMHPRASLQDLRPEWFGILNMIFTNGCEFSNTIPREQVLSVASGFVARSRRLVLSCVFQSGSLEVVQALLLMCHYLQGTLELNECWNLVGLMIRTAIGVGLHLNPSNEGFTAIEREIRKRVWWGCIAIDRTLSMKLGRPPSFRGANVSNVDLPAVVDDQYITNQTLTPRQPEGRPSFTGFFVQTIKLALIMDSVLWDLYQPEGMTEKDRTRPPASRIAHLLGCTVHLDGKVLAWWQDIPSHLKVEPDVPDGPDFQRLRNVIYMRFLNLRLLLHRQAFLLFCKHKLDDPFQRAVAISSSRECIACAREAVRFIYLQYPQRLLNALTYNLHLVFTSMGVLLSLQTMNQARLDALNQKHEEETLEWGMEFLKASSSGSTLAAQYVAMLQRMQRPPRAHDIMPTAASRRHTPAVARHGNVMDEPLMFADDPTWLSGRPDESEGIRFPHMMNGDFLDFDDLLSGTGLPRDFISGQWLNVEALN